MDFVKNDGCADVRAVRGGVPAVSLRWSLPVFQSLSQIYTGGGKSLRGIVHIYFLIGANYEYANQ